MNIDFEKLVAEAIATAVEKRIGALLGPAVRPHDPLACTMAAPSFTLMAPGAPPTRKAKTFTIKYPPWTILRRGRKEALRKFKPGTPCGSAAYAAWEALREGRCVRVEGQPNRHDQVPVERTEDAAPAGERDDLE